MWVWAVLLVYLAVAAAVLLSPLSPEALVAGTTSVLRDSLGLEAVRQGWVEFTANVALFVPFGILVTVALRRAWVGVGLAVLLSAGAELGQLLLPGRTASPRDVLANVLGATIGALCVVVIRASNRRRRTKEGTL
jgi:glycopeptide antibiotics resistance protein